MPYDFGVYHWRERGRRIAAGGLAALGAAAVARRSDALAVRLAAAGVGAWGARTAWSPLRKLAESPPWRIEPSKYRALADRLPLAGADRLLDVGCGTGRSLVGLAPAVPADCDALGLDVFDDRVILGNGPGLARRNAARAGLDVAVLRGDAARLPLAENSVDVVTACRVLHDLPADAADAALGEARRVCRPGGRLGVLELPITHGERADPADYWCERVHRARFAVERVEELECDGRSYVVVIAAPDGESA
jgi:ubiquinone/menaquinone biosynthesis C-methylase UbiE